MTSTRWPLIVLDADLDPWSASPIRPNQFATIEVTTRSGSDHAVFAGVARQSDVDDYLAGVAVDQIADVGSAPS